MLRRAQFLFTNSLASSSNRAKMSTFKILNSQSEEIPNGKEKEELQQFTAYKNWSSRLQKNLSLQRDPNHAFHSSPYDIRQVIIQSLDRFGKRIGFMKVSAQVTNDEGDSLPGIMLLRGASVGMLVILQPDDLEPGSQEEKHVLLTVQPRIAAASLAFTELPAGMVDDGSFKGAAATEIKEELGLDIPEDELTNLTELAIPSSGEGEEDLPRAMFPSAGGCDECIALFLHERKVPRSQLKEWTGKLTGNREDGEKITLKLVKLEDLVWEGARDSKALAAWALYDGLNRKGLIT